MPEIALPTLAKQNEILAKFEGISDITKGTFVGDKTITSHKNNLILEISGRGIVTNFLNTSGNTVVFSVQADNGIIYEISLSGYSELSLYIPFTSAIKIYANATSLNGKALYLLL